MSVLYKGLLEKLSGGKFAELTVEDDLDLKELSKKDVRSFIFVIQNTLKKVNAKNAADFREFYLRLQNQLIEISPFCRPQWLKILKILISKNYLKVIADLLPVFEECAGNDILSLIEKHFIAWEKSRLFERVEIYKMKKMIHDFRERTEESKIEPAEINLDWLEGNGLS